MGLAVFDSNIVIDVLAGVDQVLIELAYFDDIAISSVAWVEVMSKPIAQANCGHIPHEAVQAMRELLAEFTITSIPPKSAFQTYSSRQRLT